MRPSIGVVVPTRDRPHLLRRTLAAIAAQDYDGPLRTVVVYDQSSPDRSMDTAGVGVVTNARPTARAGGRHTTVLPPGPAPVAVCRDHDEWGPRELSGP